MKLAKHILLICILIISSNVLAQSFAIGHTSREFYDSSRDRNIQTEIYYPADSQGEDVPISAGDFPVIVFGHGYLMSWESYQNFWTELVPDGYIICFPTTEMGAFPSHGDFGSDLSFIATQMQLENSDDASLFFNAIAPQTALMGHSMGGGSSSLAAENNLEISTLVNFAAAETNPSAISAAGNVTAPTLLFSGDDDCVTPAEDNQDLMYDNLAADCKTQISIIDGGHCYFANDNFACNFGESTCNSDLDITREEQQEVTFDFLKLWLQYTLNDDQTAFSAFNDSLQSSPRVNYSQNCNTSSVHHPANDGRLRVSPNPVTDILTLELSEKNSGGILIIYNIMGEKVYRQSVSTGTSKIDFSKMPSGSYIAVYQRDSLKYSTRIIKTESK